MTLRAYQSEARDRILAGWSEYRKQLAVLPTGSGKTILFAHLAQAEPGRTLILAHREELISQACDKIEKAVGLVPEIEKAEERATLKAEVVVASIQTMVRRRDRWPVDHFGLVVIDECHHTMADSYQSVVARFDGHARVLGVTATPDRSDKKNLGKYFENIAVEVSLLQLINEGWLSRIKVRTCPIEIDLRGVRRVSGDYDVAETGHRLEPLLGKIADEIASECWDRKILIFLPLCDMSARFAGMLAERGLDARHVQGDSRDRGGVIEWFAEPGPRTLCNAMLLTEGFDQPDIDTIVCLRPTQSRPLYAQMVGRGTRIAPEKDFLLLLDFLWLSGEHNLIKPAHLIAGDAEEAAAIEDAIAGGNDDLLEARDSARKARENKLAERIRKNATRPRGTFDALELCLALHVPELADFEPTMAWHAAPASERQIGVLEKMGFDPATITCKGHASAILDRLFTRRRHGLATARQVMLMRRWGHPNAEMETFDGAKAWLDNATAARRRKAA